MLAASAVSSNPVSAIDASLDFIQRINISRFLRVKTLNSL